MDAFTTWLAPVLSLVVAERFTAADFERARVAVISAVLGRWPALKGFSFASRADLARHERAYYADDTGGARAYLAHAAGLLAGSSADPRAGSYRARFGKEVDSLRAALVVAAIGLLEEEARADSRALVVEEEPTGDAASDVRGWAVASWRRGKEALEEFVKKALHNARRGCAIGARRDLSFASTRLQFERDNAIVGGPSALQEWVEVADRLHALQEMAERVDFGAHPVCLRGECLRKALVTDLEGFPLPECQRHFFESEGGRDWVWCEEEDCGRWAAKKGARKCAVHGGEDFLSGSHPYRKGGA